jgi:hypothetical protein
MTTQGPSAPLESGGRGNACPYRKSNPDVLMVQSGQDRQAENLANGLAGRSRTAPSRTPAAARAGLRKALQSVWPGGRVGLSPAG